MPASPPAGALRLAHPPPLPVQSLTSPRHNQTATTTAIYGLILTYVLLTQFGTWLLMGVVEEKSSRVIEVLLSTLRTGQLLAGKVIGIGAVALLQAALIVAVALGLGAAEGSALIHGTSALEVVSSLLWVVLGYAFYCWVWAAAGSLADRQEQVQSLAFPLQLPILFGYIVSFTALGSGQPSELVKVLAYVPPTAPFAMPVLVGLGVVTWWEFTRVGRPHTRRHRRRGAACLGRLSEGDPAHRGSRPPAPAVRFSSRLASAGLRARPCRPEW